MKYIKALWAAARGVLQGFRHDELSLYAKDLEAFERMQESQRRHFHVTTALLKDMENQAQLARDIQDDLERRLEP